MKSRSMRATQNLAAAKKLRSELPRLRRSQISPILLSSRNLNAHNEASGEVSVNSTSCSHFAGEISCESSRISVGSEREVRSSLKKRSFAESEGSGPPCRKASRPSYGGKAVAVDGEVEHWFGSQCCFGGPQASINYDEVEESYQMLRSRERMQVFLRDYTEDYSSTTEYGGLIHQQRSYMVRWIIEVSTANGLQQETKFLAVNLLDRFLSKGFFKSKRILQIAGIACLTLATRIEEKSALQQDAMCTADVKWWPWNGWFSMSSISSLFCPQSITSYAEVDEETETRAKYLAVLQLSDPVQLCYWPSTVAAALVILASLDGNDASHQQVIETHVRTEGDDLHKCIESLEWLLSYV